MIFVDIVILSCSHCELIVFLLVRVLGFGVREIAAEVVEIAFSGVGKTLERHYITSTTPLPASLSCFAREIGVHTVILNSICWKGRRGFWKSSSRNHGEASSGFDYVQEATRDCHRQVV